MKITTQAQLDAARKGEWHDLGPGGFVVREGMKVYAESGSTVRDWNGSEWVERGAKAETVETVIEWRRDDEFEGWRAPGWFASDAGNLWRGWSFFDTFPDPRAVAEKIQTIINEEEA